MLRFENVEITRTQIVNMSVYNDRTLKYPESLDRYHYSITIIKKNKNNTEYNV